MYDVPRLPQDERVFRNASSASGYKALLCLEQMNIVRMNSIIHRFTHPGGLVGGCCPSTFWWIRFVCLYHTTDGLLGANWTKSVSLRRSNIRLLFSLVSCWKGSRISPGVTICNNQLSYMLKLWKSWFWNVALMFVKRLVVFLLCKHFSCIYSII